MFLPRGPASGGRPGLLAQELSALLARVVVDGLVREVEGHTLPDVPGCLALGAEQLGGTELLEVLFRSGWLSRFHISEHDPSIIPIFEGEGQGDTPELSRTSPN